jgi:glyoxylase-like metal-dependent hydrolase (beta-lactamase superfamily II)
VGSGNKQQVSNGAQAAAPPKYRKQEQEPASPDITEVAPGILRLQLPIHLPGLGHVNCYALEDERGFALVDPGMPGPRAWKELQAALQRAGIPLRRVHTAIVTHSHPDHFGGAGKLRREAGAQIVAHKAFRLRWNPNDGDDDVDVETQATSLHAGCSHADHDSDGVHEHGPECEGDSGTHRDQHESLREHNWNLPAPWGGKPPGPNLRRRIRWKVARAIPGMMPTPTPTTRLREADTVRFAKREWVAVHTPGHTADHLCLFDPTEGTFISGDHVLPTITPHISGLMIAADPLQMFFSSLDKVREFGTQVRAVLPAHGHPFADLAKRVDEIKDHHSERLDRLHHASKDLGRSGTVSEFSTYLFSPRAQGSMADSEAYAHLEHLVNLGRAERHRRPDGLLAYDIA